MQDKATLMNSIRPLVNAMFILFQRHKSIIGRSSWAVAGQALTVAFTLGGTRLITQFIDPSVYGTSNLVQNVVLLLRNLFCSPTFNAGLRFYPDAERGHYVDAFRQTLVASLFRSLIAVELLAIIGGLLSTRRLAVSPLIVVPMAIYAVTDIVRTLELTLLGAAQRQRSVAVLSAFETLVRPGLVVMGVMLFGASVSIVLGAMAASILVTLLAIYFIRERGAPSGMPIPVTIVHEMKQFAIPLIPVALLNWTISVGDRYIIELITHDSASIGVYAAGYALASAPMMVINGVVLMILRPIYFEAASHKDHAKAVWVFRAWVMLTMSSCLLAASLLFFARKIIVNTFLAPQYQEASVVIPWIALGYVFYVLEQVLEQRMLAQKRSHAVLIAQSSGAAASIALTIPLVMRFGMMGAAYACPIYFLIQSVVAATVVRGTAAID